MISAGVGCIVTPKCCYFRCYVRIEPGNAFKLVVSIAKYKVDLEYGLMDVEEQKTAKHTILINLLRPWLA